MPSALAEAVAAALGVPPPTLRRVPGGDINDTYDARLADGRHVFVKTHAGADSRVFACEARGLAWLREADALRTPEVLALSAPGTRPAFLVLGFIASASRAHDFDEHLGRGLARLHDAGAPSFGLDDDNVIGRLPQSNRPHDSWAGFYAAERLEPQIRRAVDTEAGPPQWSRWCDRLCATLPDLAGPVEPPARLHGDLWSGNVIADHQGRPVIIDPAIYGGHREMDLAMLRLFGSLSARVLDAYEEVHPLAAGHRDRTRLCQLYPLLVHVNLFGGSYVHAAEAALRAYL